MNKPLSMRDVRELLNMQVKTNRAMRQLLEKVAEDRKVSFQLFRLGKGWYTTQADLRTLLPELAQKEAS